MENREGKRVQKSGTSGGGTAALIVTLVVAAALVAGYVGLGWYAGKDGKYLPNTSISGVDVGGFTQEEAASHLSEELAQRTQELSISFLCDNKEYTVPLSDFTLDTTAAAQQAIAAQEGNPLIMGAKYISALLTGADYAATVTLEKTPAAVNQAIQECTGPEAQTTWEREGDRLLFHKGRTGRTVDVEALTAALEQRAAQLLAGNTTQNGYLQANIVTAPPIEPDFDGIYQELYVAAADAYLDAETKTIIPSVTGVSFNVDAARDALADTAEGGDCIVPLILDEPALSTEAFTEKLFADVLGTSTTYCAGDNGTNRWDNIDLAAARCNGVILMPGEVFSYNEHAGPYTIASGYKAAGTYQNGQSVDATAGGICQLSSTLYWTTLKANLEIVERNKHHFNGGYMPVVGTDATVYSDTLDFQFKNDTDYPIKIECYQDKSHYLHVTIYGTDTTGIHGAPSSKTVSTVAAQKIYVADASIPVGSAPVRDPNYAYYNGITVDVYQNLVDKDGNTISTTFLYRNTYAVSNPHYLYNPADAARLGIDPSTGLMTLTPVNDPDPTGSPEPDPTPSPDNTSSEPTPGTSPSPEPDPTPTPILPIPTTPPPEPSPTTGPGMEPEPTPPPLPMSPPPGENGENVE